MQPESKLSIRASSLSIFERASAQTATKHRSSECEQDDEEPSQLYCTPAAAAMKGDPEELRAFWELWEQLELKREIFCRIFPIFLGRGRKITKFLQNNSLHFHQFFFFSFSNLWDTAGLVSIHKRTSPNLATGEKGGLVIVHKSILVKFGYRSERNVKPF
jgi:hypothetical protein